MTKDEIKHLLEQQLARSWYTLHHISWCSDVQALETFPWNYGTDKVSVVFHRRGAKLGTSKFTPTWRLNGNKVSLASLVSGLSV